MNRNRKVLAGALGFGALALVGVACGGGDDNSGGGDDQTATDSGPGKDSTVDTDSGPPADTGAPDTGPFCNTTPCVIGIATGGVHTCALIADGTLRCWGGNLYGALGSGTVDAGTVTPAISATPIAVPGESSVVAIAGGGNYQSDIGYTCALHANKTLDCWGFNEVGEIGVSDASTVANPSPQSTLLTNAVDVSAGLYATCAALSSGDVACWGDNIYAEVAPPAASAILPSPTILNAGGKKFVHVSVGYQNACAVTDDGHLWCWGVSSTGASGHVTDGGTQDQLPAEVPGIDSVASVAAGYEATCALKTDGTVLCFGINAIGLLGRSNDAGAISLPTPGPITVPAGTTFTQITAHTAGFCALANNGDVWCWGYNQTGQAAIGTQDAGVVSPPEVDLPTKVDGLANVDRLATGAMAFHGCAIIHGGSVKCWGYNVFSELGYATPDGGVPYTVTPVAVTF